MKKSLLAAATLLLVSTHTMANSVETMDKTRMNTGANYNLITKTTTLVSEPTTSRNAAYEQGYEVMGNLHQKSSQELIKILKTPRIDLDVLSVMVLDKEVTVKEYAKKPNVIQYQALVDVKYHYRTYEPDN